MRTASRSRCGFPAPPVTNSRRRGGPRPSREWFLKNINPFFPAYRELASTWLHRIPMRVGEGIWGVGALALTRRADIWLDFFTNLGIIQKDARGKLIVPIPGIDSLVGVGTGA